VRVIVYLFTHTVPDVTSDTKVTVVEPPQLSLLVTEPGFDAGTNDAQVTVTGAGHAMNGATLSLTVIVCEHVAVLLQMSVARYVRVIVYWFGQVTVPVTSETKVTVTAPLQLSLVVTEPTFGAVTFDEQVTVVFAGQEMNGTMLSLTVIVCEHVAVLPHASVALYVRVTVNLFGQVMLLVTSPTTVTVVDPPQLSELVTEVVFAAGMFAAQVTVTGCGQEMNGATLSLTVIV
jgi:hypothetical protein